MLAKRSLAHELVQEHFGVIDGELAIGGMRASALADTFGTPLFVYDAAIVRKNLRQLRTALGSGIDVYYSIKANPNPRIVRIFVQEQAGLEIASAAEYVRARRAGGTPDKIVFAGPGKTIEELDFVVGQGIAEIHLESMEEIERVAEVGRRHRRTVPVALRINPQASAQGGAMRMGGKPAQFGFDEETLDDVVKFVRARPDLNLCGVHLFAGTQILNADVLLTQWAHAIEVARRVAGLSGRRLTTIDVGGGLGIPYFTGEQSLDLSRIAAGAERLRASIAADPALAGARIILEPGRFLAGPAGVYLSRVQSIKQSRGTTFVVLDGGMHHHLAASGNLGQVIKRDYPQLIANKVAAAAQMSAVVVGPLCTPLDTIGRNVELPQAAVGDIVAILQSGAYALTASPSGFLSHPMPAEVLVENGSAELIRPRGTFEQPITPLP